MVDKSFGAALNGLPMWAKLSPLAMLNLVLIFLLSQSAGWIPSVTVAMQKDLHTHAEATTARGATIDRDLRVRDQKIDELLQRFTTGLRIICENGSRSDAERRNCGNIQ